VPVTFGLLLLDNRRGQPGAISLPRKGGNGFSRRDVRRMVSHNFFPPFFLSFFLPELFFPFSIPLTTMISVISPRLLPHPRSVSVAAERGGGRAGFSGRSGSSSSKRGGGRGGSKSGRGGGGRGGGGGRAKTDGNIGTRVSTPKKLINDATDPVEVSNEPSLLSAPMEVRLNGVVEELSAVPFAKRERHANLERGKKNSLDLDLSTNNRSSSSSATRPPRRPSPRSGIPSAAPAQAAGRGSRPRSRP